MNDKLKSMLWDVVYNRLRAIIIVVFLLGIYNSFDHLNMIRRLSAIESPVNAPTDEDRVDEIEKLLAPFTQSGRQQTPPP